VSVTITEPQPLVVTLTSNNVNCNGACDGNATVSVSGGALPYTYQWDSLAGFQITQTAINLCAGSYSVTVTDANGCFTSVAVLINEPQILDLIVSSVTPSTCGSDNGSACVNVIGGVAPYVFTWNDPFTTVGACIFNQYAGSYNVTVADANGCSFTMPVLINDIVAPIIDSIIITDVTCAGDGNGTAEVFATGDSLALPLTYLWKDNLGNPISTITFVSGLSGGTYTVTVTDNNGCVTSGVAVIFEPNPIASAILSSTDASCFGVCDGDATVMAGGGTTPYTYLWISNGQTNDTATGLCAGLHIVQITDANGCTTTNSDSIFEPELLVVTPNVTDVSCFGDADGAICLSVVGGTPFYSYVWSPPVGNSSCVTNLIDSIYNVAVSDMNGCISVQAITVSEPTLLTATATSSPSTCGNNNGAAVVTPAGGTPGYIYLWSTTPTQTDSTATGLYASIYNVLITDANGCTLLYPDTVTDISGPVIDSITTTLVQCNGNSSGTATVFASGGTPSYTYGWDDPLTQTTATATGLAGGIYTVVVTDVNGCTVSQPAVVDKRPPLTLIVSPDTTICFGGSAEMSVTGSGVVLHK